MHTTVTTGRGTPATRTWILDIYTAASTSKPTATETLRGDAALDQAMRRHEANAATTRLAARLA